MGKRTLLSVYQQSQYNSGDTGFITEGLEAAEINVEPMSASTKLSKRAAADREINHFCRAYYLCKILEAFGPKCSTITNCKSVKCKVACGERK